ncbi:unnamed protein product [Cuscuta epithymum]|uniref:Auxin-repressed protein n=1 Tax=Cuscuta epithymum TaxID=186058 RepID=A0AAV0G246_9ASTE|nr:unnamed protein product [Cuscuta epithymum]CAH9141682.1 unnamed protein product [Cuscuta epithymum]
MIEKLWDEVMAGPHPGDESTRGGGGGLEKLLKTRPLSIQTSVVDEAAAAGGSSKWYQRSPASPTTPSPTARKDNVWRSVFHPGSNLATRNIGAEVFDRPLHPNSPTVYDWMYSGETRSKHR